MDELAGLIALLIISISIVLSLYYFLRARHVERMALIEKGLFHMDKKPVRKRNGFIGLKFGLIFIGLSLGLLAGFVLDHYTYIEDPVCYFSMILLFGGLSLVANNFIETKKNKIED